MVLLHLQQGPAVLFGVAAQPDAKTRCMDAPHPLNAPWGLAEAALAAALVGMHGACGMHNKFKVYNAPPCANSAIEQLRGLPGMIAPTDSRCCCIRTACS